MKLNKISNECLEYKFDSGFKVTFLLKEGFYKKGAYVNCEYGSMSTKFVDKNGENKIHPDGTAHFLEHKLFENKDVNVFQKMSQLGADVNAFTSNDNTCFYFTTIDNFDECLDLILKVPSERKYTDEGIRNEEKIIAREIDMYLDDISYLTFYRALDYLYPVHPVGRDIAGTKDDIKKVTSKILDEVMDNFYVGSNMNLVIVGDFSKRQIDNILNNIPEFYLKKSAKPKVIFDFDEVKNEQKYLFKKRDEIASYSYLIKLDLGKNEDIFKTNLAYSFVLDILFGKSSKFYKEAYNDNLFITFYSKFSIGEKYSYISFEGEGNKVNELKDRIDKIIDNFNVNDILKEELIIKKKKMIGRFLYSYNGVYSHAMTYMYLDRYGINIEEYTDIISNFDLSGFDFDLKGQRVLSVIGREGVK